MDDQLIIALLEQDQDEDVDVALNFNNILPAIEHLAYPIHNDQPNVVVRIENYYETVVPRYTDIQFKEHFRMTRASFQALSLIIGNEIQNHEIPLEKKMLFTIWLLAKQESFLAVEDRFGIAKSTGHLIFKEIINILVRLMPQYIRWPNVEQQRISLNVFSARSRGFPGVVGAIDGCHIPCKQPVKNPNDYYNRKGFHSIILQGTSNHQGSFIDVFIGMPGRMHDARVFRKSPLYHRLQHIENPLLNQNRHIIGDSAYPLLTNLMTPIRDNGHLTGAQTNYNQSLSRIRSIIERSFGLLKCKFRRLKCLDISDFDLGNNIIAGACVLQNFIILLEGPADIHINIQDEIPEEEINNDILINQHLGIAKRNEIVNIFNV